MNLKLFLVEVWDVSVAPKKNGMGPLYPKAMEGYMEIDAHSDDIVHASFSPDGTALATVGMDGYVRFFQVIGVILIEEILLFKINNCRFIVMMTRKRATKEIVTSAFTSGSLMMGIYLV